jgi:hypothetical protein
METKRMRATGRLRMRKEPLRDIIANRLHWGIEYLIK